MPKITVGSRIGGIVLKKGYLVLSNGKVFEGKLFGAECETLGELVFTTGMCGYIETLTDPSYCGQIVVQTFPTIGNYGIIEEDFEGECAVKGYVVREWCEHPSNFRCQYTLDKFLKDRGICGLYDVPTREITRIIREEGVMNAAICTKVPENLDDIFGYRVEGTVQAVSGEKQVFPASGEEQFRVTLVDYGAKQNIIRELQKRGCTVTRVPYNTTADEILAENPDGIMLSNGPGDPADNKECIEEIRKLLGKAPLFGICLGHQLTALANGGKTVKLKYGHRGCNQPVKDVKGTRTFITSQNHGYAVVSESLEGKGEIRYINANDGTCEGIDYPSLNAFTVQFHPEACSGPLDTEFLFDRFIDMMKK